MVIKKCYICQVELEPEDILWIGGKIFCGEDECKCGILDEYSPSNSPLGCRGGK